MLGIGWLDHFKPGNVVGVGNECILDKCLYFKVSLELENQLIQVESKYFLISLGLEIGRCPQ